MTQRLPIGIPAHYRAAELPEYLGNPLIEALPPIYSEREVKDLLKYAPVVDEAVRSQPSHIRMHAVVNAADFFLPQPLHFDLEQRFSRLIRGGYRNRNPVLPGYWPATNQQIAVMRRRHRDETEQLIGNLPHVSASRGMSIVGVSGIGKTTAIKRILSLYPQVIIHSRYHKKAFTHCQIVWLRLEMPRNGRLSDLVKQFFQRLDQALGTTYHHDFVIRSRRSIEEFVPDMANLALKHSVGVLVIDEVQNLVNSRGTSAAEMLSFLVELDNTIGIPIVLVGTPKARPLLQGEFRSARRASGQGDMVWHRMTPDAVWKAFVKHLWRYQYLRTPQPLTSELDAALYDESQGVTDLAVKLYLLAQIHIIAEDADDEGEKLTPERFRMVAHDYLQLVQPFIKALRSPNTKMQALVDLSDVELPELQDVADHIQHATRVTNTSEQQEMPTSDTVETSSFVSPETTSTHSKGETKTAKQSKRRKRATAKVPSDLPEGSLRSIAAHQVAAGQDIFDALKEAGVSASMDAYVNE